MTPEIDLPLWAEALVAILVLAGAGLALLGAIGLLRLPTFFERVHAPALIATGGCWCVMLGTVLFFSIQRAELAVFPVLIALFIAITVPISTIFLMRASLFRARQMGEDVPPSVSRTMPPGTRDS
ncbi:MAG: multisubunit potassium/proton antiporter, PhaG subunit [Polaromonas sp.]|nr:multisubunit potassium/proton antiporter, PhaG subunit [Polaromonas sp.]